MKVEAVDLSQLGQKQDSRQNSKVTLLGFLGILLVILGLVAVLFLSSRQTDQVEIIPADAEQDKADVVVDVSGAVQKPDLYILKSGARVNDALVAAGGLSAQADREWVAKSLNLARLLKDGEKIFIKAVGQAQNQPAISNITAGIDTGMENCLVNLNTATAAELDKLPGIGTVLSQRIIDYRAQNGSFANKEDLLKIQGISKNLFDKIKDQICL